MIRIMQRVAEKQRYAKMVVKRFYTPALLRGRLRVIIVIRRDNIH